MASFTIVLWSSWSPTKSATPQTSRATTRKLRISLDRVEYINENTGLYLSDIEKKRSLFSPALSKIGNYSLRTIPGKGAVD
jgi:hypothetical protein